MRPLTEEETKTMFTKLSHYIGNNIVHLVDRQDSPHVFRLHRDRVYYASEVSLKEEVQLWNYLDLTNEDLTFPDYDEAGNLCCKTKSHFIRNMLW